MSTDAAPPLPTSIWVVAWASLAGQAAWLTSQGPRVENEFSLLGSVLIGALVIGYVAAGVVRARTLRLVVAWVVLVLGLIGEVVDASVVDGPGQAALVAFALTTSLLALGALVMFHRTPWFAWQRTKPPTNEGAPIGRLVAVGVLVGVLGGLVGPADDGVDRHISVAELRE